MEDGSCMVSFTTYEGSLVGMSAKSTDQLTTLDEEHPSDQSKLTQEFAFAASDSQLSCMASEGNLIAVAGTEEIVRLFDLKKKMSCGEFSGGVHECKITALAITKAQTFLLSGGEDGKIAIWRINDGMLLHELKIMNKSRVVSMSVHQSDRMMLALYANGMLRLWNLLDGRCLFKKKVGLSD